MKKNIFILILGIMLCFSCATKKIALEQSEIMINEIYTNINNKELIDKYLYRPILESPDFIYCIFQEEGVPEKVDEEFLETYNKYRQSIGKLIEYSIVKHKYDFELLPWYDYGYPHGIYIKVKCVYENTITEESFYGYYIKECKKCAIACFSVKRIK